MEVAFEWAGGAKFIEICKITDIYEGKIYLFISGSIIRCLRRLDECIKELILCCQFIGNYQLKQKLEKASELTKRGIVFAASLYLNA